MEEKASCANQEVANESHKENSVVAMLSTASYSRVGQVYEEKVRQSIDNFGDVRSRVVVL